MKLHVTSKKDEDLQDLINIVHSIETSCHREYKPPKLSHPPEPIVTCEPSRMCLSKVDNEVTGWLEGKGVHTQYTDHLEKYENNQYYWMTKYRRGKTKEETMIRRLTYLEKWFVCIVEPPPRRFKKTPIQKYIQELEQWKIREQTKYTNTRSYYCDDEVIPILDKENLLTVQKQIFENFEKVKEYYYRHQREYERYLERKRQKEELLRKKMEEKEMKEKNKLQSKRER